MHTYMYSYICVCIQFNYLYIYHWFQLILCKFLSLCSNTFFLHFTAGEQIGIKKTSTVCEYIYKYICMFIQYIFFNPDL